MRLVSVIKHCSQHSRWLCSYHSHLPNWWLSLTHKLISTRNCKKWTLNYSKLNYRSTRLVKEKLLKRLKWLMNKLLLSRIKQLKLWRSHKWQLNQLMNFSKTRISHTYHQVKMKLLPKMMLLTNNKKFLLWVKSKFQ